MLQGSNPSQEKKRPFRGVWPTVLALAGAYCKYNYEEVICQINSKISNMNESNTNQQFEYEDIGPKTISYLVEETYPDARDPIRVYIQNAKT